MSDISLPTKGLYGRDKWTEEHEQVPKSVPGVSQGLGKTAWAFCLKSDDRTDQGGRWVWGEHVPMQDMKRVVVIGSSSLQLDRFVSK